MNLPNQVRSVVRSAAAIAIPPAVLAQGCSVGQGFLCAGTILACLGACCSGLCILSPLCIACMGGAYTECKDCF